jgi:hypothetical protein
VERLYNYNITVDFASFDCLSIQRTELYLQLERWRQCISTPVAVMSASKLQETSRDNYDDLILGILISIHYHRTLMLINRPVINVVLKDWLFGTRVYSQVIDEMVVPIFRDDFMAAKELLSIIRTVHTNDSTFLLKYATWWLANYSRTASLNILLNFRFIRLMLPK